MQHPEPFSVGDFDLRQPVANGGQPGNPQPSYSDTEPGADEEEPVALMQTALWRRNSRADRPVVEPVPSHTGGPRRGREAAPETTREIAAPKKSRGARGSDNKGGQRLRQGAKPIVPQHARMAATTRWDWSNSRRKASRSTKSCGCGCWRQWMRSTGMSSLSKRGGWRHRADPHGGPPERKSAGHPCTV